MNVINDETPETHVANKDEQELPVRQMSNASEGFNFAVKQKTTEATQSQTEATSQQTFVWNSWMKGSQTTG